MEPKGSLPHSQVLDTCHYSNLYYIHIKYIYSTHELFLSTINVTLSYIIFTKCYSKPHSLKGFYVERRPVAALTAAFQGWSRESAINMIATVSITNHRV